MLEVTRLNGQKVVINCDLIEYIDANPDTTITLTTANKFVVKEGIEEVIDKIEGCIKDYKLSKTNKEGYLKLREDFNADPYLRLVFDPVMFYCLVTHSFNYNIHINSEGKFSVPSGYNRCYFNKNIKEHLEAFQWELHDNKDKISIKTEDFASLVSKAEKVIPNTMFYVDPPYYSSDSAYGRIHYLGKWDEPKEYKLYNTLDYIHSKGGSFLLSNVIENNGHTNLILKEWTRRNRFIYKVIEVPSDFTNCNYQRKNKGKTVEILVRNY